MNRLTLDDAAKVGGTRAHVDARQQGEINVPVEADPHVGKTGPVCPRGDVDSSAAPTANPHVGNANRVCPPNAGHRRFEETVDGRCSGDLAPSAAPNKTLHVGKANGARPDLDVHPTVAHEPRLLAAAPRGENDGRFHAETNKNEKALRAYLDANFLTATNIRLYGEKDVEWIADFVDVVVACTGQPWRALREQLEHTSISASRLRGLLSALRGMMDGRADRARIARKLRALVLGNAALDEHARAERFAVAEMELGIPAAELESLLWIDLAEERPVTLPNGRPNELTLAARANMHRLQRFLAKARHVRVHVWGDAHALVRAATRFGLIVTVSVAAGRTTLDIVGPLTLFHATRVYGRTLGALVPYLPSYAQFVLEIEADYNAGPMSLRVASPALLPPPPEMGAGTRTVTRLAAALHKLTNAGLAIDPPPIVYGETRLFPDLAIDGPRGRWYVELVGFATNELLAYKLVRYESAGVPNVVFLVDERYAAKDASVNVDRRVIPYRAKSAAADVLAIMEAR